MRELDRHLSTTPLSSCAIVGRGRLGNALGGALRSAGVPVVGPLGRGAHGSGAEVVLLCVPDAEIANAAAAIAPGRIVGHCSGATGLGVLAPHEALGLHPLMTVTGAGASFAGAGCAVAGSSERARRVALQLAGALSMNAFELDDADRAAYHAAASVASNFLVTLEAAAERVGADTGLRRDHLVALVRATVENWASDGAARALTGPIVRGDEATVARQRSAIANRAPEVLELFEVLCEQTRVLAGTERPERSMRQPIGATA